MKAHPKSALILAVLVLATAALAACGEKQENVTAATLPPPKEFTLALDSAPNPNHAPIFTAKQSKEYLNLGLGLSPVAPTDGATPLERVANGEVDLAIGSEPNLLLGRKNGQKIVAVGALIQRPLVSLIALPDSGVKSASQLAGKKVGTPGQPLQRAYLDTMLESDGVRTGKVDVVNVGENLNNALASDKVAATLGSFWNLDGVRLSMQKRNPAITPVNEGAVPTYDELVFVANENRMKRDPGPIRDFMAATARGAATAKADPTTAATALIDANRNLNAQFVTRSLKVTTPTFFPSQSGRPWGFLDAIQWQTYAAWMVDRKLLDRRPDISQAMTNQHLAGEGEAP